MTKQSDLLALAERMQDMSDSNSDLYDVERFDLYKVAALLREYAETHEAAEALVDRLTDVLAHPSYRYVWDLAYSHGFTYDGPQFGEHIEALRALVKPNITTPEDTLPEGSER